MYHEQKLPAIPLMTSDPYFSVWSCTNHPAESDTRHWTGERKRLEISVNLDQQWYRLMGKGEYPAASLESVRIMPLITEYIYLIEGHSVNLSFCSPLMLDNLELMSVPVSFIRIDCNTHSFQVDIVWHDDICYDGTMASPMNGISQYDRDIFSGMMGKQSQNILGHSGDRVCIDWGYAWMVSDHLVSFIRNQGHYALEMTGSADTGHLWVLMAYDDVASIDYFGFPARAWYARNGKTIRQALDECWNEKESIWKKCAAFDLKLTEWAVQTGGEEYCQLICASYRQAVAAHKLIADEKGKPVFLSKENNSNGCIGTVDVSYPSIPLFLLYNPELVRAMCRPIFRFARCPVWKYDYAPHDVGRYPYATGQVYSLNGQAVYGTISDGNGGKGVHLPYYLLSENVSVYDEDRQMPVEECGNMILMMAAALKADGNAEMVSENFDLLQKWVSYLKENGSDPGEQLCTDDFAGHLAHNVNLALKAICGVAAFGFICQQLGRDDEASSWLTLSRKMAQTVCRRADRGDHTALTLDGPMESWSLKYNAVWDLLFGFELCDKEWYEREIKWYLSHQNKYGVPLDSRDEYSKSDWLIWSSAFSTDKEIISQFSKSLLSYLIESPNRVPFSDWYDTQNARSISFIARSVQGGIFMPLLRDQWKNKR